MLKVSDQQALAFRCFAVLRRAPAIERCTTRTPLARIIDALEEISERTDSLSLFIREPEDNQEFGLVKRIESEGFALLDPRSSTSRPYSHARWVTDSGGLQEETTVSEIPVLTLREYRTSDTLELDNTIVA